MATRTKVEELETLTLNQPDCKMKPRINKNLKPGRPKSAPEHINNGQQGNPDGRDGIQSHDKELCILTHITHSPENKAQLKNNSLSNVPMKASDDQTEETASVRSENSRQPACCVVNSQVPQTLSNYPFKQQMSNFQPQNSENAEDIRSQCEHNKQDISKVNDAGFSCETDNWSSFSSLTVDDSMPPSLLNTCPTRPTESNNKADNDFRVDTEGENMSLASFSSLSLDSILSPELETGRMTTENIFKQNITETNFQHTEVISEVPLAVVKPTRKCINPLDTNSGASCEQTTPKEMIPSALSDPVPTYVSVDGQQSIPDLLADLQRIAVPAGQSTDIATPAVQSTDIATPAVQSTDISTPAVQSTDEYTVRSDNGASSEQTTPTEVLPANTDTDSCPRINDPQPIGSPQIPQRVVASAVQNTGEGMVRKYNGACSEQTTAEEVVSANSCPSVNHQPLVINQRVPEQMATSADPSPSSCSGQQSMETPGDPLRINIPESPSSLNIDGPQSMVNQDVPQEKAALSRPYAGRMSDFVMLHTDADLLEACAYLDHLQEHSGFPDLTMDLFSNTDFGKSEMNSLASLHDKYRYILIYVTQNLTSDSYCRFLQEILLRIGLKQGNGKENRVIPVFTQTGGCDMQELDVLIGLKYFWFLSPNRSLKGRYINSVKKLIQTGRAKFPD